MKQWIVIAAALLAHPAIRRSAQCPNGSPPPCPRPGGGPPPTSIAVLYFDNLSPDTADAYLAEGLTEETIARLGGIERLIVSSRTAAQRYRGRIEADIATAVATAIAGRLLPGQRASFTARPTTNPQAYDSYLRGNHDLALRTASATPGAR